MACCHLQSVHGDTERQDGSPFTVFNCGAFGLCTLRDERLNDLKGKPIGVCAVGTDAQCPRYSTDDREAGLRAVANLHQFGRGEDGGKECPYRLDVIRDQNCEFCGDTRKRMPVFDCSLHGECTPWRFEHVPTVRDCRACLREREEADQPALHPTKRAIREARASRPLLSEPVPVWVPVMPGFHWCSVKALVSATQKLCGKLPLVKAVAGIPRSGVTVASLIAGWQNIPLLDLSEAVKENLTLPNYRRRNSREIDENLPVLIVDDIVSSGRSMLQIRNQLRGRETDFAFAAPYVFPAAMAAVDFWAESFPNCDNAIEWNLLHEEMSSKISLVDMDGVLCEDFRGDEHGDPGAYRRHLELAAPLRIPTQPIAGIVTGRLHIHRSLTEAWLRRHKIQYAELHMMPAATEEGRMRIGHAEFKASVFANHPSAKMFVESDPDQAKRIHELTGRPVIDFRNMICHGATFHH